jgi:hypothetical protein
VTQKTALTSITKSGKVSASGRIIWKKMGNAKELSMNIRLQNQE